MPKSLTIFDHNMAKDIQVGGLKCLDLRFSRKFLVKAEVPDKIFESIKLDDKIARDFQDAVTEQYQKFCKLAKDLQSNHDAIIYAEPDVNRRKPLIKAVTDALNHAQDLCEDEATKAVKAIWEQYRSKKKEYKAYKIGIATSITGSVAIGATSVGLMAASPFTGGLSAAAGIIGIAKSALNIVKEIGSAWQDVETSQTTLEVQIAVVNKAAKRLQAYKVNEYAADVVAGFLGVSQPAIGQCVKHLDTVNQKLNGLEINLHKLTIKLNQMLDEQAELEQLFMDAVRERFSGVAAKMHEEGAIGRAFRAYMKPCFDAVEAMIDKIGNMETRVKAAQKKTKELEAAVEPLKSHRNVTNDVLKLCVSLGQIPMGALHANAVAHEAAELAKGLTPVTVDLVYDKICSKVFKGTLLE